MNSKQYNDSFKRYCCVNGCLNKKKNKDFTLSFFTVPKDERRHEWLIAIDREDLLDENNLNRAKTNFICSAHFDESAIICSISKRLKNNAIPTKLLPHKLHENLQADACDLKTTKNTSATENLNVERSPKHTTPLNRSDICSKQGTIEVCKICLSTEAKMYQLENNYSLAKMYQDIMGMAPKTDADNRLPMGICWECTARLQSAASFRSKALYSDSLLQDHLKNNADLTIADLENLHRQHTILQPKMSVQEVFNFNIHNLHEQAPNTLIKSEVIGIPNNEETEIDVGNLVSEKITIKDENNVIIEEINTGGDVKTEIDLIPTTELEADGSEYFDDFSDDDCRIVEENVYENKMKVSLDNIILFKSVGSADTVNVSNNIEKLGQSGKDISSVDDVIDFIDNDSKANKAVESEDKNKTEVKKKKTEVIKKKAEVIKKKPVKRKAKTDDDVIVWVKGKRSKTSNTQPYVKPSKPIDENIITVKPLNHEDLRREILARRDSLKYIESPFKCTVCFRGFPTEDKQARHALKHTEKYGSIKCNICNIRVRKPRYLRAHIKNQHTSEFICKLCPMVTRTKSIALGHMKYHEGNKFKCPQCPVEFEKKTTLLNHLRLKHMSACVCELCGYTFVSKFGVEVHKKMWHKLFDKNTEFMGQFCEVCEVKFLTQKAYNRHLRLSSKHIREDDPNRMSNDPSIEQRRLGASYLKDPRSRRRNPKTEPAANGPVTCEQCGMVLENFRAYGAHFRDSHPGIKRTQFENSKMTYMCEHCGKFFNNATILSAHMWVHGGQKRFQCDHCYKSFAMKSNLVGHMQQHQAVRRTYDCRVCGKHFTFSFNLTRHMSLHTGLRPFKCDTCEKTFRTSGDLRSHVDHVHLKKPRPKRVRRKVKKVEMPSLED